MFARLQMIQWIGVKLCITIFSTCWITYAEFGLIRILDEHKTCVRWVEYHKIYDQSVNVIKYTVTLD